jgi:hypothetical protein
LRTRVRPTLRLVDTATSDEAHRLDGLPARLPLDEASRDALLDRALPAGAHEAMGTFHHLRQMEERRVAAEVDRLRYAVVDLAAIDLPPSRLIAALSPSFDAPIISERLEQALATLSAFAAAWRREVARAQRDAPSAPDPSEPKASS